jgi:hypothetical protein
MQNIMTKGLLDEPKSAISNSDIEILIDSSPKKSALKNENNSHEDEVELESIVNLM